MQMEACNFLPTCNQCMGVDANVAVDVDEGVERWTEHAKDGKVGRKGGRWDFGGAKECRAARERGNEGQGKRMTVVPAHGWMQHGPKHWKMQKNDKNCSKEGDRRAMDQGGQDLGERRSSQSALYFGCQMCSSTQEAGTAREKTTSHEPSRLPSAFMCRIG